jgi:antitoxin (DNA-binding transcriptional repressor) of toxin-antitoxin stability system
VITIARGDKPVARLAPIAPDKPKREFGKWKHLIGGIPPESFDPLPEEELDAWEGGDSDEFGISLPKKE